MRPVLAAALVLPAACASSGEGWMPAWRLQDPGTAADMRGVCAVDARVCWASGSGGTWLRTTDGGRTWRSGTVPGATGLDLRDVEAFDRDRALVMTAGRPARIYRTGDGGRSWQCVHESPHPRAFFDGLAFWDEKEGLAFSDPVGGAFLVLRTRDGGRSWSRVPPAALPAPADGEAGFAASGTMIATAPPGEAWIVTGGSRTRVLHSGDRGRTWRAAELPLHEGAASRGAFSVAFRGATGIVVGGDYTRPDLAEGHLARSTDLGRTWEVPGVPTRGYRSCVAPVPGRPRVWIAVGPSGSDVSTDDGGSWRPFGDRAFHALSFAADGSGWAVGAAGRIAVLAR